MLAREDLTKQVEGRAMRNKTTAMVCKFLLENIFCLYGSIGKIVVDRGELNAHESIELFEQIKLKFSLMIAYNPKART